MAPANGDEPRIGTNVRAARRARGMSLETLAGLTGRSKGWLSKIENGHARLERRQDIAALAEALEVSADSIVGEPAPENPATYSEGCGSSEGTSGQEFCRMAS